MLGADLQAIYKEVQFISTSSTARIPTATQTYTSSIHLVNSSKVDRFGASWMLLCSLHWLRLLRGNKQGKLLVTNAGEQPELLTKVTYHYSVGALCYALYYGPQCNQHPRWVPAVVTKILGTITVNVCVYPRGPTWR